MFIYLSEFGELIKYIFSYKINYEGVLICSYDEIH